MSVHKHRNNWQVRVRDGDGKWYPTKTFQRKEDAKRYSRQLEKMRDEGAVAPSTQAKSLTVEAYFKGWIKECRQDVSKGWVQTNKQIYRDHVSPVIGSKNFLKITRRDIGALMKEAQEKGLSSQSRTHIYNLIHKMYEDGIHYFEFLNFNPVTKKFKPKIKKTERKFLKNDDAWKLLNSCKGDWFGPAIWLSILAGMRPGEIQGLKWDRVDFTNDRIVIASAYNRKEKRLVDYPKQGDWGQAPLPLVLKEYLLNLREQNPEADFVAESARGGMLSYHSFLPTLKSQCKKLGITVVTPHELRHTATEIYYNAGASTEDLRRLLNHASSKTTQTYIHRTDERLSHIASQITPIHQGLKLVK